MGKPSGAKNRTYKHVRCIESVKRCPTCGGEEFTRGQQFSRLDEPGQLGDGTPYEYVTWHRRQCLGCEQWLTIRTFHTSEEASEPGE